MSNASTLNPGIKWGLIAGVAGVLANIAVWTSSREMFFSFVMGLITAGIFTVFSVLAGLEKKRAQKGIISFKEALQPVFLTFVIAGLLLAIYTYVVYNFIDPTVPAQAKQYAISTTDRMLHALGMPEDDIEKEIDDIRQHDFSMTPGGTLLTYFSLLIRYFVLAAIVSVIIRKKRTV